MEETQRISLSCDDGFIASIVVINSSENPMINQSLMSDDDFAEELQLQEVIISSLINLRPPNGSRKNPILIGESPEKASEYAAEASQSSCEICAETRDRDLIFPMKNCSHIFCKDCISRHIAIVIKKRKIGDAGVAAALGCPGFDCGGDLDMGACRKVLPVDVVAMWDEVLCESAIAAAERVYCPYKNCSALLVDDGDGGGIREAECPYCRRLFCASCKVPWHSGIGCEEFSKLGKDDREREDLMLIDLAKKKKWKRCSKCNFFVEKKEGCQHMTCRCGHQFCYGCGKVWTSTHGGCQGS